MLPKYFVLRKCLVFSGRGVKYFWHYFMISRWRNLLVLVFYYVTNLSTAKWICPPWPYPYFLTWPFMNQSERFFSLILSTNEMREYCICAIKVAYISCFGLVAISGYVLWLEAKTRYMQLSWFINVFMLLMIILSFHCSSNTLVG